MNVYGLLLFEIGGIWGALRTDKLQFIIMPLNVPFCLYGNKNFIITQFLFPLELS